MFLHRVSEFTAGGIFLIAIPFRAEQLIKIGKSRFVHPDTGQGALFITYILALPLLEQLVGSSFNPRSTANSAPAGSPKCARNLPTCSQIQG